MKELGNISRGGLLKISVWHRLLSVQLFVCWFALLSHASAQEGDTTMQYIATLETDSARLSWLNERLSAAVLSAPKSTFRLAEVYDSIAHLQNDDIYSAKALNLLGMAQYANGFYSQAAEYYLKSLEVLESTSKETNYIRLVYNNLATAYRFRKENSKSIEYYKKALAMAEETSDSSWTALISNNLGMQYVEIEDYPSAIGYYDKAIDLFGQINQSVYQGITFLSRANLYLEMERYAPAISDYEAAMELVPESAVPLLHAASIAGIGSAYHRMGQPLRAEPFLLSSLEKAEKIDHKEQLKESHRELSEMYEKRRFFDKALEHYKEYKAASDSILTTEQDQAMVDALTKYETEKTLQENTLLESQNEITNLRLAASRRRVIYFGLGLLVFVGASFWLYQLYRKIQAQNATIQTSLSEKEILLREIHHRVKNNLQLISSLLGLQTEHIDDQRALGALQEGQDRVQSMALIHQNLYKEDNLTGVDMQDYFMQLVNSLFDSYNIREEQIKLKMDIEDVNLDVDTVIPIGLIVNELISNCLKYAFPDDRAGLIEVMLRKEDESLNLTVRDNGVGMSPDAEDKLGETFGYRLIHAFKNQLRAELVIDRTDGTAVTLLIHRFELAQ